MNLAPETGLSTGFLLRNLPESSITCGRLETFIVPDDDERVLLRGQVGVRLTGGLPVPPGTFLGMFQSIVSHADDDVLGRQRVDTLEKAHAAVVERARQEAFNVSMVGRRVEWSTCCRTVQ